jgi:hypothetical protein
VVDGTLSLAVAEIGTKPDTVEFAVGVLSETVGGVVSDLLRRQRRRSSRRRRSVPVRAECQPETRPWIPAGITLVT